MTEQPKASTPSPTFKVHGIDYTAVAVRGLHAELAKFRTDLIKAMDFDHAVMLTHGVALLYFLAEWMEQEETKGEDDQNVSRSAP
jgi:hypothetical protein